MNENDDDDYNERYGPITSSDRLYMTQHIPMRS